MFEIFCALLLRLYPADFQRAYGRDAHVASFSLLFQPRALANTPARRGAQPPAFDVISLKPARSADPRDMRMRVQPNGDLRASAVPVLWLLRYAYGVPVNPSPRLSGLPGWRETYDIEAKAPANAVPAGLPESEKQRRIQAMIRALLADRFKLARSHSAPYTR